MRVGIRFCGGCNPVQDRRGFEERLRIAHGARHRLEPATPETPYDYLVLIGGCSSCCIGYRDYTVRERVLPIRNEKDFEHVMYVLDMPERKRSLDELERDVSGETDHR